MFYKETLVPFEGTKSSPSECVKMFEEAAIWDGKNFWEAECQMQWVED